MARGEESFTEEELTRTRKAIGEHTLDSVRQIPQFDLSTLVNVEPLVAFREELKRAAAPAPTLNDLVMKAVALTLREHPRLNAWCDGEKLMLLDNINVGFAVSTDQGVLLPTVRGANLKSLAAIAAETRELISLARTGRLRASLQMGAGFTLSNFGPVGVDAFAPIISPPQVAILGVGSFKLQPMVVEGEIVTRAAAWFTLVVDHRAIDGAEGAAFLAALADRLADPELLERA